MGLGGLSLAGDGETDGTLSTEEMFCLPEVVREKTVPGELSFYFCLIN